MFWRSILTMRKNTLFRGCTRPPMFLGVPYIPFFLGAGFCFFLAAYLNLLYLLLLPIVILILRQISRQDEMIFRLWGLRLRFIFKIRNKNLHSGMWVFSPNNYRKGGVRKL